MLDPDWPGWDDVFQSSLPTRGSDPSGFSIILSDVLFQSSLPTRGSDVKTVQDGKPTEWISILAPHEGERH